MLRRSRCLLAVCVLMSLAHVSATAGPPVKVSRSSNLFKVPSGVRKMTVEVKLNGHYPKQQTVEIRGGRITRVVLEMEKRPQFTSDQPKVRPVSDTPGIVKPGNVALASNGATVSGVHADHAALLDGNTSIHRYALSPWPCEWTVTLDQVYRLQQIRMKLWDGDNRYYRYTVETSVDGKKFEPLVDRSKGQWKSWQFINFPPRPVKAIRIHGLYNSVNEHFHLTELEAYCLLPGGKVSETVVRAEDSNPSFEKLHVFLGIPEDKDSDRGPVGLIGGRPYQIKTVTIVKEVPYTEYEIAKSKGRVLVEEEHQGYVYFATKESRDVPFDNMAAWVEVLERKKAKRP